MKLAVVGKIGQIASKLSSMAGQFFVDIGIVFDQTALLWAKNIDIDALFGQAAPSSLTRTIISAKPSAAYSKCRPAILASEAAS